MYTLCSVPKKRLSQLHVRCSIAEQRRWKQLAEQSNMTLSEWLRQTLNNGTPFQLVAK